MIKETFTIKLTYEMSVDTDTGKILETKLINREVDKSDLKQTSENPKLFLEENKYKLNNAAVELMNLDSDSRLSIVYRNDKPYIKIDENGNKLTKNHTVSFRNSQNKKLSEFGHTFIVSPSDNMFILISDEVKPEPELESKSETKIPEQGSNQDSIQDAVPDDEVPFGLDMSDLIDDTTDIDSNFFKF